MREIEPRGIPCRDNPIWKNFIESREDNFIVFREYSDNGILMEENFFDFNPEFSKIEYFFSRKPRITKKYYFNESERTFYQKGILRHEYHYDQNGNLHRDNDLPSYILYYASNLKPYKEMFFNHGKYHRDNDKPAIIFYHENRKIEKEIFYEHGIFHRNDNKPASIRYYENGLKEKETFYNRGIKTNEKNYSYILGIILNIFKIFRKEKDI
jgi:hypothetical protein